MNNYKLVKHVESGKGIWYYWTDNPSQVFDTIADARRSKGFKRLSTQINFGSLPEYGYSQYDEMFCDNVNVDKLSSCLPDYVSQKIRSDANKKTRSRNGWRPKESLFK